MPNRVLCGTGFTEYQNRYFRDESMDECKTDAFRERIHNGWCDKAYFCFIMTERTVETFSRRSLFNKYIFNCILLSIDIHNAYICIQNSIGMFQVGVERWFVLSIEAI